MNEVAITQDKVTQKMRQQDNLQIKMRELSDQREYFQGSINNLEDKITTFRTLMASQTTGARAHAHAHAHHDNSNLNAESNENRN